MSKIEDIKSYLKSFQETCLKNEDKEIQELFNSITDAITKTEANDEKELMDGIFGIMLLQCKMYATLINNVSIFGNKELIKRCGEGIKSLMNDLENE